MISHPSSFATPNNPSTDQLTRSLHPIPLYKTSAHLLQQNRRLSRPIQPPPPPLVAAEPMSINAALTDDELRAVLARLSSPADRDGFGLVCRRWLRLQSTDRRLLRARAGPAMLRRMADRFPGVRELDLSQSASRSFYPGVTDADLAVVAAGFAELRVLDLKYCKGVTDAGMIVIGTGLPSIQSLDVSGCRKLTDKGLVAIAQGCYSLKSLHLVGCKSVTDNLLRALSRSCAHLEDLGLAGCTNISDIGLTILVDGCRHIKSLDVSKCSKVGDVGVSRVTEVCSSSLRTLKVLDCFSISGSSIISLASYCKNLETLVIGGCPKVSDECIKSLALACGHSLRNLRMDWCSNITDSSLSCIFTNCKYLVALDIGCCDNITDAAFHGLGNRVSKSGLKVLRANNCPRITVSGISTILQFCQSMEYLDFRSCPLVSKLACDQAGLYFPKCCRLNLNGSLSDTDSTANMFF